MRVVVVQRGRLHPAQRAILDCPARYKVVSAGRRFGKTRLAIEYLVTEPLGALDGLPVAYFAPRYKYLVEVYAAIERMLSPLLRSRDKTMGRLSLVNGGVVEFWTLEDTEAGRSRAYAKIVVDEAAHVKRLQEFWEANLRPTLADYGGSALFVSTPLGYNYFYELFQRAQSDSDWAAFQYPTSANPHIPAGEIEAARKALPELVFRQEYLAEFVNLQGALLRRDQLLLAEPPAEGYRVVGVDLAISKADTADFTAMVEAVHSGDRIYISRATAGRYAFREALERVEAFARGADLVAVESVAYQAAFVQELIARTNLPIVDVKPDRDKVSRFWALATRIQCGNVLFSPNLPESYFAELLTFPEGLHDDFVDATVYAVFAPAVGYKDLVHVY